jgi:hypothetical protein
MNYDALKINIWKMPLSTNNYTLWNTKKCRVRSVVVQTVPGLIGDSGVNLLPENVVSFCR